MDVLEELDVALDRHLAWVLERARVPPAWAEARAHYGLAVAGAGFGPAGVESMREVLRVVTVQMGRHLEVAQASLDPARAAAGWNRLARFADEEAERYRASLAPRGGALGSIFQNATASVGKHWWDDAKWESQVTLLCKSCGAPQQRTRDYKCGYCAGDLFRRPGDDKAEVT